MTKSSMRCPIFREKMIGGDYSVTIVYPELKEKYAALFTQLPDVKDARECSPVDEKYR